MEFFKKLFGRRPKDESLWQYDQSLSEEENDRQFQAVLSKIVANLPEKTPYPDPMLPPWQECPDIPMFSIGWRMGGGEDYMHDFHDWFDELSEDVKQQYIANNPEPEDWEHWWILKMEGTEAYKAAEAKSGR